MIRYVCPTCGAVNEVHRRDDAPNRPFCSDRCRWRDLGKWFDGVFRLLVRLRGLRGTALDPFGYAEVRRVERQLVGEYRSLIEKALADLSNGTYERAVKLASLPDLIRGYEEIKLRNVERFRDEVRALGF